MKPAVWVPPKSARWAAPKSASLALPAASKKTLAGLTSRWTMPARWAAASADSSSSASRRTAGGSSRPCWASDAASVPPGQVLQHQDARPLVDVAQAHDVGVAQAARGLGLAQEAQEGLPLLAAAARAHRQDLQHHRLAQQAILGGVDPAQGARADQAQLPEAAQRLGRQHPAAARLQLQLGDGRGAVGQIGVGGMQAAGDLVGGVGQPQRPQLQAQPALGRPRWCGVARGRLQGPGGIARAAQPAQQGAQRQLGLGGGAPDPRPRPPRARPARRGDRRRSTARLAPGRAPPPAAAPAPVQRRRPFERPRPFGQLGGLGEARPPGEGRAGGVQLRRADRRGWPRRWPPPARCRPASSARRMASAGSPRRSASGRASANRQTRSYSGMARRRSPSATARAAAPT